MHNRVVVYTSVIGEYDDLHVPSQIDPDCEYVAFTNGRLNVPSPWVRREPTLRFGTDRLTSRYYKAHPHLLFPEFGTSIWVDASFQIRGRLREAAQLAESEGVAMFAHPERNSAYLEAETCRQRGLDDSDKIDRALCELQANGYPPSLGLSAGGVIVRNHHNLRVIDAMRTWWRLLTETSERDQISLDYSLWKAGVRPARIPGLLWSNDFVEWVGHPTGSPPAPQPAEVIFDKYERLGPYHWAEWHSGAGEYVQHVRFCLQWVRERPCLDIGCGDGLITYLLGAEGIDSSAKAIEYARERGAKALLGSAYDLPKKKYKAVFMGDVLEHLERPHEALAQVRNVLEEDGFLYVVTPPKQPVLSDYHYREYTPSEFWLFLQAEGFALEEMIVKPEWVRMYGKFRPAT